MNEQFLFLDKYAHTIYNETKSVNDIRKKDENLYNTLKDTELIVPDDYDEKAIVELRRRKEQNDTSVYHIIINPTLGCNLSCWYCYEHKITNSRISDKVVEGIKKNIKWHYEHQAYNTLKLSFFGGEPLLYFYVIRDICGYAKDFCQRNNIELLLDFTTNGTLLDEENTRFLSDFNCIFQITLDGNREQHNKVKYTKERNTDTYGTVIKNIINIQRIIPQSFTYVRINFDKDTMKKFDDILHDIKAFDRKRTVVILKKIWQVKTDGINKDEIAYTIDKLFKMDFIVDYYTQGKLCFAERLNEVVINYDGNVFKCTTISNFDQKHSFGKLDSATGMITWDENKLSRQISDLRPDRCIKCKIYPTCYGPCNYHLLAGQGNCFLDGINMSMKEYLIFMVKQKRQKITVLNK